VPGFVVQGLDPRGDGYGTGGPSLRAETNEWRYARGIAGMPDAGRDTGGCQLFVTFRPQPRLDDRYTVFARVTSGIEVVERLDVGDRVSYVLMPKGEGEAFGG
jgi:cyclophilin family peptidyl-prolyl cis-trans isomerase